MAIIELENLPTDPPVPEASRKPREFSRTRRGIVPSLLTKVPNRTGPRVVGVSMLEPEPEYQQLPREQKWAMLRPIVKAYVSHPHAARAAAICAEIERRIAIL